MERGEHYFFFMDLWILLKPFCFRKNIYPNISTYTVSTIEGMGIQNGYEKVFIILCFLWWIQKHSSKNFFLKNSIYSVIPWEEALDQGLPVYTRKESKVLCVWRDLVPSKIRKKKEEDSSAGWKIGN